MEQTEKQLQSQGICSRVFYFITKALVAQASKPVTLGGRTPNKPGVDPLPDAPPSRYQTSPGDGLIDQMGSSGSTCSVLNPENVDQDADYESIILIQEVEVENATSSCSHNNTIEEANELEGATSSSASSKGGFGGKALKKKTVSINDEVEVIAARKKKRKVSQISKAGNEDEESRPLKSILRVGSIQT